jgi:hypothetical protein
MGAWAQTRAAERGSGRRPLNRFVDKKSSFKLFLKYQGLPILPTPSDFRLSS